MQLHRVCQLAADAEGHGDPTFYTDHLIVVQWPLEPDPPLASGYLYARNAAPQPLSPTTDLGEGWIVLDYIGHLPETRIWLLRSEQEVMDRVLGGAGIFNPFTSELVVFHAGRLWPYTCFYQDAAGRERVFDPRSRYRRKNPFDDGPGKPGSRRLAWAGGTPAK